MPSEKPPPPEVLAWVPEPRYRGPSFRTRRRRRLLAVAGIAAGTLALLVLAAFLLLPYLVRHYVIARIENRFGVTLQADDIDAGFGSVSLRGVQVRSRETGLPLARLDGLAVEVDVWALLRGRIGIRRLDLDRPVVAVELRNDDQWAEVVAIGRRIFRGGRRLAGGGTGSGPEVRARNASLRLAYGDDLVVEATAPQITLAGDRRLRIDSRDLSVRAGNTDLARADSFQAAMRLAGGRAVLDDAVLRHASLRWTREPGTALEDSPPVRALRAVRRMAAVARRGEARGGRTPAGAAPPAAGETAPPCPLPIEGTVRLEESEAFLSDPRLGDPLRSAAVAGSLDLRECGTRARAEASGDGGPESGGWRGWIERVAGDVSGEVAFEARAFDRVARRVLPAGDFPAAPAGPVTFALSRKAGERALRVSGTAPVPEAVLGAGGRAVRVGPERAAFDAWVGPLAGGRLELAGRVDLGSAVYAGPAGESRFRALSVRLDHGTTIDFDRREARLAALVDGAFAGPVRVWDDPALEVERPVVRADLAVSRDRDRRFRLEGGVSVAGLVEVGEDGRARWPVAFEGAFDPGTWIQPRTRTAQLQGRFLVDGLRVERRGMPLVALGPPGCEAALAIRPGSAAGLWVAEGDVRVRGLTVDSPKVAREPVAVVLDVAGVFAVDVPARQGTLEQGRVRVGEVEMAASGAFAGRSGTPAFRVALAGSHVRCQDLLEALPPPLRADLPGLEFGGSVDFHLAFDVDLADPRSTVFDLNATSRCRVTAAAEPIQMQRLRGTFRHEIVLPGGRTETIETGPGSPDWVPLSEISPYMVAAVVTTEDARFFRHSGVSIRDLREAIVRDLREGRFAYGGSTIDMQVVKNVFLDREKTVARKVQELILTWWLDQALDKNQIMELYLNVIEYGPGIYGIGPAARHFFGRIPADLSPLEAVYLAKLLPDPVRRYRMYSGNLVPTNWRNRLDHILGIMYQRGDLAEEEYQAAVHDRLDFYYPGEPLPPPRYGVLGPLAPAEEPAGEPLPPEDPGWRLLEEPPPDDGGYPPAPEVW